MCPPPTAQITHLPLRFKTEEALEPARVHNMRGAVEGHNHAGTRFSEGALPPPFLCKTYDIVDDPRTDAVISWAHAGCSFVIWDPHKFSASLLPRSFKHSNFSSFIRQLNTYGFKKVDPDRWEFANEGFVKGHKNLLKQIHRRKYQHHPRSLINTSLCTSNAMEKENTAREEVNAMKREKNMLLMEVIRLRQRQQETEKQAEAMLNRLHVVEHREHHMVAFIARALHNPDFMAQLIHESSSPECLDSTKLRQFLPTSVQCVLDVADESQLCGTLEFSTISTSKRVQEPDEDEHGSYMLLEFLASDVEAKHAHLEALSTQEMDRSTLTTNSYPVKMVEVGLWGGCTAGLPLDVESANKFFGLIGQGSSQNTEFGLPYMLTDGDNTGDLERMGGLDCEDAEVSWEQLMLGIPEGHSQVLESPSIIEGSSKEPHGSAVNEDSKTA